MKHNLVAYCGCPVTSMYRQLFMNFGKQLGKLDLNATHFKGFYEPKKRLHTCMYFFNQSENQTSTNSEIHDNNVTAGCVSESLFVSF